MSTPYAEFIARRRARIGTDGVEVARASLHSSLKPFQRDIVQWACKVGRPAVWADTGLGKTRMQLEWARSMAEVSLIVAPLGVARQTPEEAALISSGARYVRSMGDIDGPGVYVTNYEMIGEFDPRRIGAVALDEASILKQSDGKTRTRLIRHFEPVPFRSTWTATPAPNDPEELTNQAEFLGHMTRTNMLAAYFVHDQDGWRLKGHAIDPMLDWMSEWAVDPDMFFPDSKAASGVIPEAKKICAGCDVAAQCLAYAIRNGEQHGVWGGLTGQELQALKTRQQPRLSPPCNTTGCDKPRFSRGMCQPHYRAWLEVQASDEARKQAVS